MEGNIRPPLEEPEELEIHEMDEVTAPPGAVVVAEVRDAPVAPPLPVSGYLDPGGESYSVDVIEPVIELVVVPPPYPPLEALDVAPE